MVINEILGNVLTDNKWHKCISDNLELQWYELNKRILRKTTRSGREIGVSLPANAPLLHDGDVLAIIDQQLIIMVKVMPCECIAIYPKNYLEVAKICYEIGNRHAPLFSDEHNPNMLLLAMDKPLYTMLEKLGAHIAILNERLVCPLGMVSSIHHHEH